MSGNYSTREFREKLYDDLHVRLRDTLILMCSIFIASIGLNMNSTAVVIGAMLISPLMTPIVGLGFGLAIFDTRLIKQSLQVLLTQVLVSLLVSTLYFWMSPLSYASSELIARTSPTIWDVLIAIAGGIAGFIGSRKKEANNIVPGVAIATALMPPICTAGYGLANGNVRFLFGALYLFLINCVFIMLINIVGTRIFMRKSPLSSFNELNIKMKIGLISLIVLLILPASYSAVTLTMDQARKEGIKQFVGNEFANHTVINQVYKSSNNELVLTVVGGPISEEELETIRQKQASYGIQSVQLKVKQFNNSAKLDSETIKEFYENIDKYIDQKLSEKDSQDDIVKEIEADKD
ncbi:TIGR00341 family protein [Streptococcus sp. oral taxon 061]|uniref:TIGR00341 family protein n=1 Tax=Streptococcus sp. oral taxon 061 TaxID=712623 RepID=UPI0034D3B21B